MSEKDKTQQHLGDPPPASDTGAKHRTRYRVLWAAVPADEDEALRYREIRNVDDDAGWYEATNLESAKRAAFADKDSEDYGRIQKAAEERGVILRAAPASSWGEDDPKPTKVEVERKTAWGF